MSDYNQIENENAPISMDENAEVTYENTKKLIPDGVYLFTISQMKRMQVEQRGSNPAHVKISFLLRLENEDGNAGTAWDDLRMYMKFAWKFSDLAKSIGDTPPNSKTSKISWSNFIGKTGRVQVTHSPWKKMDGTIEQQNNFKYLLPAVPTGDMSF